MTNHPKAPTRTDAGRTDVPPVAPAPAADSDGRLHLYVSNPPERSTVGFYRPDHAPVPRLDTSGGSAVCRFTGTSTHLPDCRPSDPPGSGFCMTPVMNWPRRPVLNYWPDVCPLAGCGAGWKLLWSGWKMGVGAEPNPTLVCQNDHSYEVDVAQAGQRTKPDAPTGKPIDLRHTRLDAHDRPSTGPFWRRWTDELPDDPRDERPDRLYSSSFAGLVVLLAALGLGMGIGFALGWVIWLVIR